MPDTALDSPAAVETGIVQHCNSAQWQYAGTRPMQQSPHTASHPEFWILLARASCAAAVLRAGRRLHPGSAQRWMQLLSCENNNCYLCALHSLIRPAYQIELSMAQCTGMPTHAIQRCHFQHVRLLSQLPCSHLQKLQRVLQMPQTTS